MVGAWRVLSCFGAATGPDRTGSPSRGFVVPVAPVDLETPFNELAHPQTFSSRAR